MTAHFQPTRVLFNVHCVNLNLTLNVQCTIVVSVLMWFTQITHRNVKIVQCAWQNISSQMYCHYTKAGKWNLEVKLLTSKTFMTEYIFLSAPFLFYACPVLRYWWERERMENVMALSDSLIRAGLRGANCLWGADTSQAVGQ